MPSQPYTQTNEQQERNPPSPRKPVVVRILRALKRQYHHAKRYGKKGETEHQRNERTMAQWTRRLGMLTIVLAFIAAVTAVILYQSNMTARESQRANVFVKSIDIHVSRTFSDQSQPVYDLIANWANGGTTGAVNLEYRQTCGSKIELGQTLAWKQFFKTFHINWERAFIGPGATQQSLICAGLASKWRDDMYNVYTTPNKGLYLVGEARYSDVYQNRHYTSFCFMGQITSPDLDGVIFTVCRSDEARFNCVDDKKCEQQQ